MNEIYYKAIEKLKEQYLPICRNQSVIRAITILEKKAKATEITHCEIDMEFEEMVPFILKKLNSEKMERSLSNIDVMQIITHIYLSNENFTKVNDEYHLPGIDAMYTFTLHFIDKPNTVILNRLENPDPNAKHGCKSGSHIFAKLPSLLDGSEEVDRKILKNELRKLRADLKRTWEYIHIDKTPTVSSLSSLDLSEQDFQ